MVLRHVVGTKIDVAGREHLPTGPVIYAVNHQSYLDSIFLTALLEDASFVLRENLYDLPVVGWYLRNYPMIGLKRDGFAFGSRDFLRKSKAVVQEGRSVVIFPEGTRVPIDENRDFKKGVGLLQRHLGIPIVPIAHNLGGFWTSNSSIRYPGYATVAVLEPMEPAGKGSPLENTLQQRITNTKVELFNDLDIDPLWFIAQGFD